MRSNEPFFCRRELRDVLEGMKASLEKEVGHIDRNELLNVSTDDLNKYLVEKFTVRPIELVEDETRPWQQLRSVRGSDGVSLIHAVTDVRDALGYGGMIDVAERCLIHLPQTSAEIRCGDSARSIGALQGLPSPPVSSQP